MSRCSSLPESDIAGKDERIERNTSGHTVWCAVDKWHAFSRIWRFLVIVLRVSRQ
jgi:hypothetical protein